MKIHWLLILALLCTVGVTGAQSPRFKAVVVAEWGSLHDGYVRAGQAWLAQLAADSNFEITNVADPNMFTEAYLAEYQLVIQLNYPPFSWNATAQAAFEKYVDEGRGGWIGFHHASLYGDWVTPSDEQPWSWAYGFLGNIQYRNYISETASGTVQVEDANHPCMKGLPSSFVVTKDEWYTWDQNPRPNVRVLATVDEDSYVPSSNVRMGDHPTVWTNEHYPARNLYVLMGHSGECFENQAYTTMFRNAIFWASGQDTLNTTAAHRGSAARPALHAVGVRSDRESVEVRVQSAGPIELILTDAAGRRVLTASGECGRCRFDRSRLGSGVYFLQVGSALGWSGRRLVLP
jgi:type 1 glutamine amidotransferase